MEVCLQMPLVIHPRVRRVVQNVAATACAVMFAGSGAALAAPLPNHGPGNDATTVNLAASCPAQALSAPFSDLGDLSSYFAVPTSSSQAADEQLGWDLENAFVAPADGLQVHGLAIDQAVTINGGGSATSPWVCMDSTMPSFRFFAHQVAPGSSLMVQVLVRLGASDAYIPFTVAQVADGSAPAWKPIPPVRLANKLLRPNTSVQIAFRFWAPSAGAWQVGGLYVDPFRTS